MDDIKTIWIVIVMLILVLGPGGAAWVGTKVAVNGLRDNFRDFRKEVREELGEVWSSVNRNKDTIAENRNEIDSHQAVLEDRGKRGDAA